MPGELGLVRQRIDQVVHHMQAVGHLLDRVERVPSPTIQCSIDTPSWSLTGFATMFAFARAASTSSTDAKFAAAQTGNS